MVYLLDVNLLLALCDAQHSAHDDAHAWFARTSAAGWASCPLTENGFVRIASNPRYPTLNATPAAITGLLTAFCAMPSHTFWPDSISLTDRERFTLPLAPGSAALTDIYLLALAVAQGGKLATLDRKIPVEAVVGGRAALELIAPGASTV